MPKISIIMPVCNSEKYLEEALDSLINQTLEDIEIICIDDCSKDSSNSILGKYASKDSRIKIIRNMKNLGAGYSRNLGVKYANGNYITFLDADDFIEKNAYELAYNECTKYDLDIGILKVAFFDDITKKDFRKAWVSSIMPTDIFNYKDVKKYVFTIFFAWSCNKVLKRSFILENNIKFSNNKIAEDICFTYIAILLSNKIKYVVSDNALYHYRRNTSISCVENLENRLEESYFSLVNFKNELKKLDLYEECKNNFVNLAVSMLTNIFSGLGENNKIYFDKLKYEYFKDLKLSEFADEIFYNEYNHYKYKLIRDNEFSDRLVKDHFSGFNLSDMFIANTVKIGNFFEYCRKGKLRVGIWEEYQNGFSNELLKFCKEKKFSVVEIDKADVVVISNSSWYEAGKKLFNKKVFDMDAYLRFGVDIKELIE